MRDLHNNIKVVAAIEPRVIMAGNATYTSAVIDRDGYESLEFVIQSGALTDGAYAVTMYDDSDVAMGTEAAVVSPNILGTNALAGFALADDVLAKKIGYVGNKRYVRLKIVQSAATTGGYITAVAVLGHPKVAPVT